MKLKKENVYGYVSTICCMIAAFWIAVNGEAAWSWIVYTVGGVTGIVHLYRQKDKSTMLMYVSWTIFDILAIIRIVFDINLIEIIKGLLL